MLRRSSRFPTRTETGHALRVARQAGGSVLLPQGEHAGEQTQACGVRDHRADYAKLGAVVLGVSPDPVKPIANFADKFDLGFTLLSDEDHKVAESYGVWVGEVDVWPDIFGYGTDDVRDRS